jgi:hypothetical protein
MLDSVRIEVVLLSWSFLRASGLPPNDIQCKVNNVKACGSFGHLMIVQKTELAFFAKRRRINDCLVLSEGLSQLLEDVKEFLPILL